jgi:cell division inhibitor SulA
MVNTTKAINEEVLPAGTLTEIRSISYLDEQSRDLQRDSLQNQQENLQQGLKQMLPALAGFCRQRWLVLVAPPCLPSQEELKAAGINPARVLLVHPGSRNGFNILEQTLRSGNCGAVLAWLEKGDASTLERLRLAAEAGNAWGVLFRTARQGKCSPIQTDPQIAGEQLKMAMN